MKQLIFVFGSNLAGRHGAGAAKFARENYGAQYGIGEGITGNAYAIPTKDENIKTLPLNRIEEHVKKFLEFAKNNPKMTFNLTLIGCGLAGYKPEQIAPMFKDSPENVKKPEEFLNV